MKNKILVLVLIGSFTLISCSKEDDSKSGGGNNKTTAQKIVNLWNGVNINIKVSTITPPSTFIDTVIDQSFTTYDFKADGTINIDSLGTNISSGTWALTNNDDLILDINNVADTLDIIKITSTEFIYYANNIQSSPFGDIQTEFKTSLSR